MTTTKKTTTRRTAKARATAMPNQPTVASDCWLFDQAVTPSIELCDGQHSRQLCCVTKIGRLPV